MIRIAILADIHANLPALRSVLADADSLGCSRIYHAGDLVSIGPYPAEVVDLAMEKEFCCVKGNHEEWFQSGLPCTAPSGMDDDELRHYYWTHSRLNNTQREYLARLPYVLDANIDQIHVRFQHFALCDSQQGFKNINPDASEEEILASFGKFSADLVCFGHLHERPLNRVWKGSHFLNPGSVGCSCTSVANYAVVEIENGLFRIIQRTVPYERNELLALYDRLEIPAGSFIRRTFFGVV